VSCRIQITFTDSSGVSYYEAVTDDMATAQQFADRYIKGKWPADEAEIDGKEDGQ
jgi:hypothetical protein